MTKKKKKPSVGVRVPGAKRTRPKELGAHGLARRAEVVRAASHLLMERGYGGLSMRQVAERVGMKLGNLQYYFPTRISLLNAVLSSHTTRARDLHKSWLVMGLSPAVQFVNLIQLLSGQFFRSRGFHLAMLEIPMMATRHRSMSTVLNEMYEALRADLAAVIRDLNPLISQADSETAAVCIISMIDGMPSQGVVSPDVGKLFAPVEKILPVMLLGMVQQWHHLSGGSVEGVTARSPASRIESK